MILLGTTTYHRRERCTVLSHFGGKYRVRMEDGTRRVVNASELKRSLGNRAKDDAIAYAARMNGLTRQQARRAMR